MTTATQSALTASVPSFDRHPSPFLGDWILYCMSPMDFGWNFFPTVDQMWKEGSSGSGSSTAFHLGAFLQIVMNAGYSVADDLRESPRVIALPGDCDAIVHGFIWKIDNNGTTFVALRQPSAKHLAPLIGLDQFSDPVLINIKSDDFIKSDYF